MARGGDVRAGKAFVELFLKNNLAKGLRSAGKQMKAFGSGLTHIGKYVAGLGAAITTPLVAAVHQFASAGDQLDKMSARTGVAVEFLSALGHAANLGGTDLASMEKGLRKLQKTAYMAAEGSDSAQRAFSAIGVSVKDSSGKLKSSETLFMESVSGLSALKDETLKAALAQELFGKSGTSLLPMLKDGAGGLQAAMKEAEALGLVMSTEDATSAAILTDMLYRLTASLKMVTFRIGAALAPTITALAEKIRSIATPIIQWVKNNGALIVTVAKIGVIITAVGGALIGLGAVFGIIGAGLTGAATLVGMFATVLSAIISPVGLAIAAIAALGYWITFHTEAGAAALDWLKQKFQSLLEFIRPIVQGVKDALSAGDITLAAKILWLGVKVAFAEGKARVMGVWREFATGIVQIFDEAINKIIDKWRQMNTSIATLLIKLGDKLGLLGSLKADDVIATLREDSARAAKSSDKRLEDRTNARGEALSDATKADKEELAKLRASLGSAVKQARVEAVEAELRRAKAEPPKPPEVPGLPDLAMAGSARGTFSAAAASTFGRGADRQVRLLEDIKSELKDLNDTVEDADPLLFAGE